VGLHQKEADARGIEYRLVKTSDEILGFTALAPGAGEMLPVISLAMAHGLGYQAVRDLIFTHPTLNEGLPMFLSGVEPL
jgi:pyruvate/2-oxoglutarate dehydrogenase complex dihydrolipoamide dehydrogenase (E3) component